MKARLTLEDGWSCLCESFTGAGEVFGELVFNTGLTGYQEIITDPSYHGQIVMMTGTQVGNYGIREREDESTRVYTEGLVVREYSGSPLDAPAAGHDRFPALHPLYTGGEEEGGAESTRNPVFTSLAAYLRDQQVLGLEGLDTRELTRHVRDRGAMIAGMSTETLDAESLLAKVRAAPKLVGRNLVQEVTSKEPYLYSEGEGARVAVLDCGIKISSLRELALRGCRVEVFPSTSSKDLILSSNPDGLLLSNGPGDPAAVPEVVSLVESLLGETPIFGICLGHQMIGQALGAGTYKLKFGHHGTNHPVRDERTGKVYITSQNHGFNVDEETLDLKRIEPTFINLNDRTVEGLRHRSLPLFSVQFHPEAGPGPHDARWLFDEFLELIR
jgi:carbamoyl-phosphate synthase small subunit